MRQRSGETLTLVVMLVILWWDAGLSWWWFGGAVLGGTLLNAWQTRHVWAAMRQSRRIDAYLQADREDAAVQRAASEGEKHSDAT